MNSEKRIIYKTSTGLVRVIVPADNIDMTVEEIAQKDVPTGLKYKIVNKSEITDGTGA